MATEKLQTIIQGDGPGRTTELNGFRIGPADADKKVYLQGALHADEQPGIMALCKLLPMLMEADSRNQLNAEFVVYPMVNPLGMATVEFGMHQGRYDLPSGVNFNRGWPDLFSIIAPRVKDKFTQNEDDNAALIRASVKDWLLSDSFVSARMQLRQAVMLEAHSADYVFDLHCDDLSLVHIFSVPQCNTQMQSLGRWLDTAAILTAEDSGGGSFDEVWTRVWIDAAAAYPDCPFPPTVAACTIELRGQCDVSEELGVGDAEGLYGFFQSEGLIAGTAGEPVSAGASPTPLTATEILRAGQAGLLDYKVALGDRVVKGQVIAQLIELDGDNAFTASQEITAGTDGIVLSMNMHKYVWSGCSISKIVGIEPLASRGEYLLED